jgi:photosystem II stability/assembly factor-like uncharacterized protein
MLACVAAGSDWEEIGPHGTSVHEFDLNPARPGTVYARSSDTGIHRSDDGGRSWRDCAVQLSGHGATAFAVSPHDPDELLVNLYGHQLFRTTTGCENWEWVHSFTDSIYPRGTSSLTFVPRLPRVVLFATTDLLRSDDRGESWTEIETVPDGSFQMIETHPVSGRWWISGRLTPLYFSDDEGLTWTEVEDIFGSLLIAIDPFLGGGRMLVASWRNLYRSDDGGDTFSLAVTLDPQSTSFKAITFDPNTPNTVWAITNDRSDIDRVQVSRDGGETWTEVPHPPLMRTALHDIVVPRGHDRVVVAQHDGVAVSEDSGTSWQSVNEGFPGLATPCAGYDWNWYMRPCMISTGRNPEVILTRNLLWTEDGGTSWNRSFRGGPFFHLEPDFLAPDPHDPSVVFAGNTGWKLYRSSDQGRTFIDLQLEPTGGGSALIVDPHDASIWYTTWPELGGDRAFRSTDHGTSWTEIFAELEPAIMGLMVDPHTPGVIIAIAEDNSLYRSFDNGDRWHHLAELYSWPPYFLYPTVVMDPTTAGRMYATTKDGYFRVSDDGGATWTQPASSGDFQPRLIIPDPVTPGRLYGFSEYTPPFPLKAGSDRDGFQGIVVSTDAGLTWNPLEPALDNDERVIVSFQDPDGSEAGSYRTEPTDT